MLQDFQQKILTLIDEQIRDWPLARDNYSGLKKTETRLLTGSEGHKILVQFNPARIRSSAAKVDERSISERPCFLCQHHLPEQQKGVPFNGKYIVLVNPYPIFRQHLTIPYVSHIPQRIGEKMEDMLDLAFELSDFVVFYNGPHCGASAPDHFHFQAIGKENLPIEEEVEAFIQKSETSDKELVHAMESYGRRFLIIKGDQKEAIQTGFEEVYESLNVIQPEEPEPMMNVICWRRNAGWVVVIFPRQAHRPWQYDADNNEKIVLSPASVDLGGVLITPREEDFEKLNMETAKDIFSQVCLQKGAIV